MKLRSKTMLPVLEESGQDDVDSRDELSRMSSVNINSERPSESEKKVLRESSNFKKSSRISAPKSDIGIARKRHDSLISKFDRPTEAKETHPSNTKRRSTKLVQQDADGIKEASDYSEGESGSEFLISINNLKPKAKLHRTIFLWKKVYSRTKAGASIC